MHFEGFDMPHAPNKAQSSTVPAHERRKPRRDGQDAITIPEDLPVKTVVLDIPDAEKVCKETGMPLVHIGNETTHKLAHEPGSYYIKEIIRPKYAHPQRPEDGVLTAELPDSLIPKCRADESLLAEVVVQKFADHMPLYRIAESMGRINIQISRKLLSQWVIRCGMALKPLYEIMLERVAWARSPEERLQIRQKKEVPIIDELIQKIKDRLIKGNLLPKSKFREALGYFCGLIPYLKNYTKHPFARMDNNVAERAIRPLTIGRKNWLFFGSEDGGEAGAILLSFVQTCRGLKINPREYLEDVFRRLMGHSSRKLEELLPDQWLLARNIQNKSQVILTRQPV
jgi:transposase